jgi:hypothetical protein
MMTDPQPTGTVRQLRLPRLVQVGPRAISTVGWRNHLAYQHLEDRHTEPVSWCDPKCMARTMFNHAIASNQEKVRRRFGSLFNYTLERRQRLIARQRALVAPYRIIAFRLYSGAITGPEAEALGFQIRDMAKRRDLSAERVALALDLIDRLRLPTVPS